MWMFGNFPIMCAKNKTPSHISNSKVELKMNNQVACKNNKVFQKCQILTTKNMNSKMSKKKITYSSTLLIFIIKYLI